MFFLRSPLNYISLCCIVKDENDYLDEWINYHRRIGVEKFYIYDNESKIPVENILTDLIKNKTVVVEKIFGVAVQRDAYNRCLRDYGKQSRWIGFIDMDEFIVPKSTNGDLKSFLRGYEQYGGLGINWMMFGSSGHTEKSKQPQIERFLYRSKASDPINNHIKCIVQPRYSETAVNPHFFIYSGQKYCVNENQKIIEGAFSINSTVKIQLNHYFCRSLEEFKQKMIRGRADTTDADAQRKLNDFEDFNKFANEIMDDNILVILGQDKDN